MLTRLISIQFLEALSEFIMKLSENVLNFPVTVRHKGGKENLNHDFSILRTLYSIFKAFAVFKTFRYHNNNNITYS